MARSRILLGLLTGALAAASGCDAPVTSLQPVFVQGRSVSPDGDSLFAVADLAGSAVVRYDRSGGARDTLGAGEFDSPGEVQVVGDSLYVSDVRERGNAVAVLTRAGGLVRWIELDTLMQVAHQFAALPSGGIVVETLDQRLVTVQAGNVSTFAAVDRGPRPSLLAAAGGGAIHAVHDKTITLYNGFGNIRWRIEWPWDETAFVSDIAEDTRGRIHLLVGNSSDGTFRVFTLAPTSGEVFRWSVPARTATFVVDRLGEVIPDAERWGSR